MPGTSKNFEGGSWAEVWLSCEHRSFFWLIICSSEFNLPFFFDPPSIDTVALEMNQVSGHHDVSDVWGTSSPELPFFGEGSSPVGAKTGFGTEPASPLSHGIPLV